LFVVPIAAVLYTLLTGQGDPVEGLKQIGKGNDPFSQALAGLTSGAVNLANSQWPNETRAVLNFMAATGAKVDAVISYVDDKTGKVVSSNWNAIPEETRFGLIGAGKVVNVAMTANAVAQFKNVVTTKPASIAKNELNASKNLAKAAAEVDDKLKSGYKIHTPSEGPGPLSVSDANTFRSGTYFEYVTKEPTTLYRVWGGEAGELGAYWTKTPPTGPLQSIMDSALDRSWGNTAQNVTKIQVPAGTKIFEGVAAPQGWMAGGGSQVIVQNINKAWIVK
jgi:hypothetical protein